MQKFIAEIVREAESNYISGNTTLSKYVSWSMSGTIDRIDAYLNSQHTTGSTDAMGRDKPFFNIVTAATNVWYRATDLDRKNVKILPSAAEQTGIVFVANVLLQDWMRRERFGMFLNQWGRTLAKYGSAVVKFVERDGRLIPSVVPWNRFIADPVDFNSIPRIEKFYKTKEQLKAMATPGHPDYAGYDMEKVDKLCEAQVSRKTIDGQNKDSLNNFIEIYEVHGYLPDYLLEENPEEYMHDENVAYRQQMHVISFTEEKTGEYQEYCLFKGREKKDPYMITHLIEEDGRTLAIGAVEYLFDAQWMQNHSVKNMKDTLDLASKLIFQTSDAKFIGRNVLSAIETGDILIHQPNMPLTQINNSKPDIQAFQAFGDQWRALAQELSSTPDAIRGNTLPSGTPYSLGAILQQQANSLFEIMTENKGLYLEDMLREYIIPFLKKQMDNSDEIVAILDSQGISEIDSMYVPAEAVRRYNKKTTQKMFENVETLISGGEPDPLDPFNKQQEEAQVKEGLAPLGNKRFFKPSDVPSKTWKTVLKDLEWNVIVEVTNENTDKQAVLQTLSTTLQTIASNPMILQDPNAKMLFGKILTETSVVSPMELSTAQGNAVVAPTPAVPTGAPTGVPQPLPIR